MKNLILLCYILLLTASCGKSDNNSVIPSTENLIRMKINGVLWEGQLKASGILNNSFVASASKTTTTGVDNILIGIDNVGSSKTFTFESADGRSLGFYNTSTSVFFDIAKDTPKSKGIITFTKTKLISNVTHVSATFSGTAVDANDNLIQITEGQILNALTQ